MAIISGSIVKEARTRAGLTQRELARQAGTAQSVVARVEGGDTSPSIATLSRLLAAAGYSLQIELVPNHPADPITDAYMRDIDRSLLLRNLEKSPTERVQSLQALVHLADEARRAGVKARASG